METGRKSAKRNHIPHRACSIIKASPKAAVNSQNQHCVSAQLDGEVNSEHGFGNFRH